MTFRHKLIYSVAIFISFTGCVKTFGSNYYAQKAYQSLGLQPSQPKNSNVMPYNPNDKKAVEQINPYAQQARQQFQAQSTAPQQPNPQSTAPQQPNPQLPAPQAQYQPYPLNNTANNAMPNPSRQLNPVHITNSHYAQYLAELSKYYTQYAEIFSVKGMVSDSQLLRAKSATAKSGNDVMFETENSFNLPLEKQPTIASQRKIVENVKSRTEILKEMPISVAQLQASFDCVLIEAKNNIFTQKTVCGMAYQQAISAVEAKFGSMNEAKPQVFGSSATPLPTVEQSLTPSNPWDPTPTSTNMLPISDGQSGITMPNTSTSPTTATGGNVVNNINIVLGEDAKPKPKEQSSHYAKYKDEFEDKAVLKFDNHKSFAVYYDVGSFALDASAIYSINKAIEFTRDYDDHTITVLGFTDRTSSRDYNKVLSDKRANAVYDALIKRGIAKEKIKKVLFGEDYNTVSTRDGVGEAFNRRVVIEVNTTGKFDEEDFITEKGLEGGIIE